jgi:hypothetical protein
MRIKQASLETWRTPRRRDNIPHTSPVDTTVNHDTNKQIHLIQQQLLSTKQKIDTHWGHQIISKKDGIFRIGLRNVNSLPIKGNHNKNTALIQDIMEGELDILCATEINVAWQNVSAEDKLYERFRGSLEFSKFVSSNNKDIHYKDKFQRGGTLTICQGAICARTISSGTDSSTMGRWSWIQVRGRHGLALIVVTIYRPVFSDGPLSTYQQQRCILLDRGIDTCPRQQILDDLAIQIERWKAEGLQVIVAGDFNEDVRGKSISNFFAQLQMREMILEQHGHMPPNTYVDGSVPIDGIFATGGINSSLSGYTSFSWGLYSDHRMLWVDLDMSTILGTNAAPLWKPMARRLKCEDPRLVEKFVKTRLKHMQETNIDEIKHTITEMIVSNATVQEWGPIFEELDQLRVEGILHADRQCRRLCMGNVPWSPELQLSMTRIGYYQRCRLKYCLHRQVNSRTLMIWFKKAKLTQRATSAAQVIQSLREEFITYNSIKKQAPEKRRLFLETLAEAKANEGDLTQENILKQLLRQEEQRSIFKKIKAILTKFRQRVVAVEVPNEVGGWDLKTTKLDIEQGCIDENIRRFSQANSTPPLLQHTVQSLGWKGETETATNILSATNMDETLHPAILRMVPFWNRPNDITRKGEIETDISKEDFSNMWHKCKEYTSCGRSGLHFGHFKASCTTERLCEIDRWFVEVALKTGVSLERWKQGIDVMIPKKSDSLRVDKLRTIVLMEPDFNMVNKIIGKRIMRNAEDSN